MTASVYQLRPESFRQGLRGPDAELSGLVGIVGMLEPLQYPLRGPMGDAGNDEGQWKKSANTICSMQIDPVTVPWPGQRRRMLHVSFFRLLLSSCKLGQ
jgi:hypothetical protein